MVSGCKTLGVIKTHKPYDQAVTVCMQNTMTQMQCPKCDGRAFDISKIPREQIAVSLKCPNCQNIVTILCTTASKRTRIVNK